ncbi:MAG: hypothetical protein A2050_12390 [Candidatus Rokubacteria bacterium GWA2_73_35]|nr:MAG: hypothetical protein A2050_12390 [Candidatus Rokubacteria bacterium GWA2_73_35]
MTPGPARSYFEDVELHDAVETPAITLTAAHVGIYHGLTRELDADPAAVPDLLPLCVAVGLGWRTPRAPLAVLALLGLDWQPLRPLRAGDTVRSRSRIVARRPLRDGGVIVEEREVLDQRGEVVQRGRFTYLVGKRPKEVAA